MAIKAGEYSPRPFTGQLSAASAIKGAQLLQENAARLTEDAKILLQAKRYPSAAMMAVMALDELSRIFHPLIFAALHMPKQLAQGWKQFRCERQGFPWSIFQRRIDWLVAGAMSDEELNDMLSFIRALGGGADYIAPGLWIDPKELISAELAASIVGTAELFCKNAVETKSMEIWMEAVGSLPRNATIEFALKKYQAMLESEGLAEESLAIDVAARGIVQPVF
jgi:AbiV family abortive infection protein